MIVSGRNKAIDAIPRPETKAPARVARDNDVWRRTMAIGLLFEIPGMTQEQYDATVEAGGEGTLPPGQIFHMAGPMEGGWRVIDLWETRADFDRFAEETLAPAMGGQVPVPSELPVHAFQV